MRENERVEAVHTVERVSAHTRGESSRDRLISLIARTNHGGGGGGGSEKSG